jgi:hypothetical protein
MKFKNTLSIVPICLAATLWASAPGTARADLLLGNASLDGGQEVPASGSAALGVGILAIDTETGLYDFSLFVSGITSADLMGVGPNLSPIHLHSGAAGVNGPIIVDLGFVGAITPLGGSGFKLDVTGGTFGGMQGALDGPSVEANIADLLAGNVYVNIHTTGFGGGEIRGQLVVVPEPSTIALGLLGLGSLGLMAYRRRQ